MSDGSFGRYRLHELLGEGGMGQVYRAFDTETNRIVALKLLPPHLAHDHEFERRFRREAQTAASLSDPHIVPIHHFGEIDGRLYVDMRLIVGRDLAQLIRQGDGGLEPSDAVAYVEQLAEALQAAHDAGLVHRDVKPSNVLVTDRNFVYLIDFGIAQSADQTRLTNTGLAIGTFAYMAPERMRAGTADSRSDVYALACVLHECLTGKPPFAGHSVEQLVAGHLMTDPPRPSTQRSGIHESFDEVISKGMAKDPEARYQTTIELAAAARRALASGDAPKRAGAAAPTRTAAPTSKATIPRTAKSPSAAKPSSSVTSETRRAAARLKLERDLAVEAAQTQRRRRQIFGGSVAAVLFVVGAIITAVVMAIGGSLDPSIPASTLNPLPSMAP